MKKSSTLIWISLSIGLLFGCKEISPITPRNPIIGQWTLEAWQVFHLPAWYAIKTNDTPFVAGSDSIYGGPLPIVFDVSSLTFTPNGEFSEFYYKNPGFVDLKTPQVDRGTWTLSDSIVHLNVPNGFPHKLTYRAATDELVTDIEPKTSVVQLGDGSVNTVSYFVRIYYIRKP